MLGSAVHDEASRGPRSAARVFPVLPGEPGLALDPRTRQLLLE